MQLVNEFSIPTGVEESWAILTDVRRIAPCLPGAYLMDVDGDTFEGGVRVKVGPITASYRGTARFVEMDPSVYRAVLRADAREERGSGNARADIEMRLQPGTEGTSVTLETQLAISGRLAQFGRGVIADISSRLIAQFAAGLEQEIRSPGGPSSSPHMEGSSTQTRSADHGGTDSAPRAPQLSDVAALPWPDAHTSQASAATPSPPVVEPAPLNLVSSMVVPQLRRWAAPAAVAACTAVLGYLAGRRAVMHQPRSSSRYGTMDA
jgi:carbon monoxide dehydrogenase subunit G